MTRFIAIALLLTSLSLGGCTWVKLSEGGQTVTVVSAVADSCKKLGSTTSSTKADLASFDRKSSKVATELETLARNAAADMGADTIVAETEVSESGTRRFGIYRCGA